MTYYNPHYVYCRLYDVRTGSDLVLAGSSVDAQIADVHASVVLAQKFQNPLGSPVSATYTFGMLAGAAVCGFDMVREDGTKVEGMVKEKEAAKKEYDQAVSQGYTASLGQEETKDVFSISVGNISPNETVTVNLRFLQPLLDDEKKDQIKFIFPRTYAQRYGSAPTSNAGTASTAHQPFEMKLSIQQASQIKGVSCPSGHSMSLELGKPSGLGASAADLPDGNFAQVSVRDSSGFLTQDVVVVITAAGLDSPRAFIEPHPSPNHPSTAIGLTFVPRFKLPDPEGGMEYVFVVDRSGSMQGTNMELVKEALVVLLRGLPTKKTSFNIVSFGSQATMLWPNSKPYMESTLDEATKHVDSMQADYGGTEIASALEMVYSSITGPLEKPVSVFLLTDGAAWDISACVTHTKTALQDLPSKPYPNPSSSHSSHAAPGGGWYPQPAATQSPPASSPPAAEPKHFIRVFTLGIGDGSSSDTCDSIARAGKGMSVYVKENEPVMGKCARLVRAARTVPLSEFKVLWPGCERAAVGGDDEKEGDEDEFEMVSRDADTDTLVETEKKKPINLFANEDDEDKMDVDADVGPPPKPDPALPPPLPIQQAPLTIPSLFPGTRTQIYAVISDSVFPKGSQFPASIKIRAKVSTTGDLVELDVPVTQLIPVSPASGTTVHTLAAKATITELEDGKPSVVLSESVIKSFEKEKDTELRDAYVMKSIVRLGTEYGLTSKHTSFVAIDRREQTRLPGYVVTAPPPAPELTSIPTRRKRATKDFMGKACLVSAEPAGSLMGGGPGGPATQSQSMQAQPFSSIPHARERERTRGGGALSARRPQSSVLSMDFGASGSAASPPPAPPGGNAMSGVKKNWHPLMMRSSEAGNEEHQASNNEDEYRSNQVASMSTGSRLAAIARQQSFEGSFKLTPTLVTLVFATSNFQDVISKLEAASLELDVAATLLAVLWLEKNTGEDGMDLVEKATEWLEGMGKIEHDVREIKERISKMFVI